MNLNFERMWDIFYEQFVTEGGYRNVLLGLRNTLIIAIFGLIIGIVIGTIVATVQIAGRRNVVVKIFAVIGDVYTSVFRGTPIIVQLLIFHYIIFVGVDVDGLLDTAIYGAFGESAIYNMVGRLPLESVIVFGLNSGAYVAEIMRGGILSVDIGQTEAGRTLGLSYTTTMFRVVIPQAIKNVVPTLGNELIALTKDTSVAGYVATMDLNAAFTAIAGATYDYLVPYLFLALVYLVLVILMTVMIRQIERRMRKSERR